VAGLQALILLVVVPAVAWAVGLLVLQSARRELTRESGPQLTLEPSKARILLHLGYSAMPILLGLVLYALARPALDAIDRGSTGDVVRLEPVVLWASFAYAVAAGSTLAAQTWIVKSRLRAFLGPEFGRVLPLWVVPATGVIFALILVFLLLAYVPPSSLVFLLPRIRPCPVRPPASKHSRSARSRSPSPLASQTACEI